MVEAAVKNNETTARDRLGALVTRGRQIEHDLARPDIDKIDQALLLEGISFFQDNFFSMFVCMMTGLLSLMYINSITVILHLTGRSSSPSLAYQRYLRTMKHTNMWYTGQGVDTLTRSLMEVKLKHRAAAKQAMSKGHLMSQYDMVLTQWAFIGPALIFPSSLGLPSPSDGLVYIMYLVGRYLGVSEDLNLCSVGVTRATEYSKLILTDVFQPAILMESRSTISREMASYLLKGVNMMVPFLDDSAFESWFLRLLSPTQSLTPSQPMSTLSTLLLKAQIVMLETILHLPLIGKICKLMLNMLMRLAIFLNTDWEKLVIQFHELADWPAWFLIVLAFVSIPVLSLGSLLRRVKRLWSSAFIFLTFCILCNVTTRVVKLYLINL